MNEELDRPPREEDLAFFGRIAADVSHDMRNVLSVISEYSGLMDDLLGLAERGSAPDCAKLRQLCAKTAQKLRDGTETMERFSRFAHAADEPTAPCDLTAVTETIAALARRRVALAGSRMEVDLPAKVIAVTTGLFALQHVLFAAIELVVESLDDGAPVHIKLAAEGPAAVITISGSAACAADLSHRTAQFAAALDQLKGKIETAWTAGIRSLFVTIPLD